MTAIPLLLLLQVQAPANTPRPAHDAIHYDIDLTISARPGTSKALTGRVTTTWRLLSTDPIRVELDSAFGITAVRVNQQATSDWSHSGDVVLIPHQAKAGDTLTTTINYTGIPRDGLVVKDSAGLRTVFADNWPNRAHRWFPSQDHPSDKASVDFAIHAMPGVVAIANGVPVDSNPAHGDWRFRIEDPIPVYTMVVGIANMARTRMGEGGCPARCIPIEVWTYPADSAYAVTGPFRRVKEIVDYFSEVVGEFPYPRLAHVQTSTIFGGMENSTVIFYDEGAYRRRNLSESTVAHETAHQWFGDAVTEREWPHLWLSEGFATYFAALWAGHLGGDSALQVTMQRAAQGVFGSPTTIRPVIDSSKNLLELLNTNNYQKGSWVLHSLRGVMGDSAFFAGIREYYRVFRDSTALSSDFERIMEGASGEDLGWYFQQALHQPGYPKLEITSRYDSSAKALHLTLRQTQAEPWGVYRLPQFELLIDGLLLRVDVEGRESRFSFDQFASQPKSIVADPNGWWLSENSVRSER